MNRTEKNYTANEAASWKLPTTEVQNKATRKMDVRNLMEYLTVRKTKGKA
jgi:hypothetical protein